MPARIGGFFLFMFDCMFDIVTIHGSCSSVLEAFIQNPVSGLYTSIPNATLGTQAGLRQYYEFGLYSYCGFVSATTNATSDSTGWVNSSSTPKPSIGPGRGTCTGSKFAMAFTPYDYITSDMLSNYTILSNNFIPDTPFRDSSSLHSLGQAAYWMLLLGTISIFFAIVTYVPTLFLVAKKKTERFSHRGIKKTHFTFFLSSGFFLLSAVLLLIAVSIYTALIRKCEAINTILLSITDNNPKIPVGIVVTAGKGLSLMWAACACMLLSVVPYFIR